MLKKIFLIVRNSDLNIWVFTTGAIVLIIEVVAVRILAPFFGNTLYSVSSVLSVILLALSGGYWVGGILADRSPKREVFYSIILSSGALVLLVEAARHSVLSWASGVFSLMSGPLIASLVLFIGPAFLLGMLSPIAIKLRTLEHKKMGIGRVAGGMFFWSTLGSIFGSILAGFVLIPTFGVNVIMVSVGALLFCMGSVPLVIGRLLSGRLIIGVFFLAVLLMSTAVGAQPKIGADVLYQADGVYERITIRSGLEDGRPAHFLVQDRSSSGASYTDSDELVYDYTKYYSLFEAFSTTLDSSLVLGGGAYSIPKALLNEPSMPTVDVVDIEPSLYDLAKQYFSLKESDRLTNYVQDGRMFLAQSNKSYDLIYGDVYHSLLSIPTHFTTKEFFQLAKDHLSDDGVFVSNVIGDMHRGENSFLFSQMRTVKSVFPNSYYFAVNSPADDGLQNFIVVGAKDNAPSINFANLRNNPNPVLTNLESKLVDPKRFNIEQALLLEDNYAPVDKLIAGLYARSTKTSQNSGETALSIIQQLLSYGPRYSGSDGNEAAHNFISAESRVHSDSVSEQTWEENGKSYTNVVARIKPEIKKRILLATHYDSRRFADQDKDVTKRSQPLPGANDSASGVATLLTLLQQIGEKRVDWPFDFGIDVAFFDGEEGPQGDYEGEWRPVGSQYFATHLADYYGIELPKAGIVVDMVCEKHAKFYKEISSVRNAPELNNAFWSAGSSVNSMMFPLEEGGAQIRDDHTPLNDAGVPSIVVIDFEYPQFHTTEDTIEQCDATTLRTVISATSKFLEQYNL